MQRRVRDPDHAKEIAPPPLEIAQVVGVVDDAGKVGVLVIDAHGQLVLAAVEDAGGRLGKSHAPLVTLSSREREGPIAKQWEGEGLGTVDGVPALRPAA